MEDKEAIIKAFVKTLQLTRIGRNVVEGEYYTDGNDEEAILYEKDVFSGRIRPRMVNITADSGMSIIKDIVCALEG